MPRDNPLPNPQALVLFSGGKDSFLTAARLVEQGYDAVLVSFNNGSVLYEKNLLHGAARLKNRYGDRRIEYAGAYGTISTIWSLNEAWTYMPWDELGRKYPGTCNCQVTCLHCQTAMWIAAIAYAKARSIKFAAAGYKDQDEFCTGIRPWIDRIAGIAGKNQVTLLTPLWKTPEWGEDKKYGRDVEMIEKFFEPSVLEPKCILGRPKSRRTRRPKA